jgi:hypothetical protein
MRRCTRDDGAAVCVRAHTRVSAGLHVEVLSSIKGSVFITLPSTPRPCRSVTRLNVLNRALAKSSTETCTRPLPCEHACAYARAHLRIAPVAIRVAGGSANRRALHSTGRAGGPWEPPLPHSVRKCAYSFASTVVVYTSASSKSDLLRLSDGSSACTSAPRADAWVRSELVSSAVHCRALQCSAVQCCAVQVCEHGSVDGSSSCRFEPPRAASLYVHVRARAAHAIVCVPG